jgi:porin
MASSLHGSAGTAPRVRAELQASKETSGALAKRYGLSRTTVAKWRARPNTADAPMGPRDTRPALLVKLEIALIVRFVIFVVLLLFPLLAEAQDHSGTNFPPLLIPIEPPQSLPASGTEGGYFFNLRPVGADFGRTLANYGIYLQARDLSEVLSNVSGGVKRGTSFEGYTAFGFDLDMNRIAGIPGGSIHFQLDDLQGQSFNSYSGSAFANNRIFAGNGPAFRLQEFSYEQSLFNGDVNLRLGRIPAYTQFDGSELYCTFLTSLCRTPAGYTFNRGYPPYLASSWAAVAQIRVAGPFYTNFAVYENEPILSTTNHGGFPGPDWGLNNSNGATIPVQFGYRTTVQNDAYPRAFAVGGFYNTGSNADPLLNTAGQNRILFGGAPGTDVSASEVYILGQQMVYRPDMSSDRGLTLFGGANWTTSGQTNIQKMIFGGAYYKGLFAQRPNDTLGFSTTLINVNPRITERNNSILSLTTGGHVSGEEVAYEVNYGFAVAPGLTLKPFLQFISHPDQATVTRPSGNNTHALFVGALFEVDMASLFGLPTLGH